MKKNPFKQPWIRMDLLFSLVVSVLLITACSQSSDTDIAETPAPTAAPTIDIAPGQPERGQAKVNDIELLIMESFPVQVSVLARGELSDTCTRIDEVITQQSGSTFRIVLTTYRQPDQQCAQVIVPFEQNIPLDVAELRAGTYDVIVNSVTGSFTLDIDNTLSETPDTVSETPTDTAAAPAGIGGFIWHDLCASTGGAVVDGAELPEGCVVATDGITYVANGIWDDGEPGIPGVQVRLLAGDCTTAAPGEELFALSDESGAYIFNDISAATYCVFLETADEVNAPILGEGIITAPTVNGVPTNSVSIDLVVGVATESIDFGYDYRFEPIAEAAADCTNSFEFVQDLTVPDNTVFPPAAEFDVAWRLRNNGTCPWTTDYQVAFVGGDPMGEVSLFPLVESVAPGQTSDVSISLVSPDVEGTYRSNWQLSDAAGNLFGINGQIEEAFWVQIVVQEGAEVVGTPTPGSSVIGGVIWNDVCFLSNGQPSRGCVETVEGSGFYRADGSLNFGERPISGITVTLGRGACPEGGIPAPADVVGTQESDVDGLYRFENLDAGIYCVAIDALSPANVDLLIPGNWTYPAPGTGRAGIRLAVGEERLTVDFGWDFQE